MSKPDPLNYAPPPRKNLTLGGLIALILSSTAALMMLIAILIPSLGKPHIQSNRSACGANLTGIVKAMNLYAAENTNQFPIVSYAPYSTALNNAAGHGVDPSAAKTFSIALTSPYIAGSPTANLWLLVLNGMVGPKQFICKSDPTSPTPSPLQDSYGRFLDNFQSANNNSYSSAYPWDATGKASPIWIATVDSSIPVASDMAPLQGTGSPPIDVRSGNSANHKEGQEVAFADTHVEFDKTPIVGQGSDNIWTIQSGPPSAPGLPINPALPIPLPPGPPTPGNLDTIMLPIRNATTGAF